MRWCGQWFLEDFVDGMDLWMSCSRPRDVGGPPSSIPPSSDYVPTEYVFTPAFLLRA